MEKMYQEYKDIAIFRFIYIGEAHASDSVWPVAYAVEKNITKHKNYGERCEVAQRFLKDENMSIPTIVDNMDNKMDEAYDAMPTRAFIVRKDGRLGVAGAQGPRGLVPSLKEAEKWLAQYKKSGKEPGLP